MTSSQDRFFNDRVRPTSGTIAQGRSTSPPPHRLGSIATPMPVVKQEQPPILPNAPFIPPSAIVKQIAKDVLFIKEYAQRPLQTPGDMEQQFIFRITNDALKDIDFTLDFRESDQILVSIDPNSILPEQANQKKKQADFAGTFKQNQNETNLKFVDDNQRIVKAEIKMKQPKVFICSVTLLPNWKLKSKIKCNLKNCSIEQQKNEIKNYKIELENKFKEFYKVFQKTAVSHMSIQAI